MKKIVVVLFLTFVSVFVYSSVFNYSDITDNVSVCLKNGNAKELSKYMSNNVSVSILNDEGMYTKFQTELILSEFFNKNKPSDIKMLQKITNSTSHNYVVYSLITSKQNFRVFVKIAKDGESSTISELRIEPQTIK